MSEINWTYFYLMNPNVAVAELKHKMPFGSWRYVLDIINTRVGMFTYDNLPRKLTSKILETSLLFGSDLCFYKPAGLDRVMLLKYTSDGTVDEYNQPTTVSLHTLKGENDIAENVPFEDIVLVRDNTLNIPRVLSIDEFIFKLLEIEDDLFKIMKLGTLPAVLSGSKKQAATLKVLSQKLGYKDAFIVGDESLTESVKGFNINIPFNPLDVYELRNKYYNEAMRSLGIYSVDAKRERIVTQELINQNDFSDFIYQDAKIERQLFVDECNRKFGTNIVMHETYDINYNEAVEEKANLAGEVIKSQAEAIKEVDPNATIGGGIQPKKSQ